LCAVLLALLVGAGLWWWPFHGGPSGGPAGNGAALGGVSSVARMSAPTSTRSSTASSTASSTPKPSMAPATPHPAPRVPAVLAGLDGIRAAAFARRDPSLLAGVYASSALLARDRALLTSIVPRGCGLRGVHTRFSHLVVTARTADRIRVRVQVALGPSTLVCGDTPSGRAAGAPVTTLQIELVHRGSAYRIAAQKKV
jgi:hypothetical protein